MTPPSEFQPVNHVLPSQLSTRLLLTPGTASCLLPFLLRSPSQGPSLSGKVDEIHLMQRADLAWLPKSKKIKSFFFFLFFPILQQGECHAVVLKAVMTQPKTLTEEETLHPSALR